ncbi:hypothetical protein LY90DRAFT_699678, partial [Neocallimastix californiae]
MKLSTYLYSLLVASTVYSNSVYNKRNYDACIEAIENSGCPLINVSNKSSDEVMKLCHIFKSEKCQNIYDKGILSLEGCGTLSKKSLETIEKNINSSLDQLKNNCSSDDSSNHDSTDKKTTTTTKKSTTSTRKHSTTHKKTTSTTTTKEKTRTTKERTTTRKEDDNKKSTSRKSTTTTTTTLTKKATVTSETTTIDQSTTILPLNNTNVNVTTVAPLTTTFGVISTATPNTGVVEADTSDAMATKISKALILSFGFFLYYL